MKIFKDEFFKLYERFKSGSNFSFAKFGDGEWEAILGNKLDNNEFYVDSNTPTISRNFLYESLIWDNPNYYIGLGCPCCIGQRAYNMRSLSKRNESHTTFANVFVNANYDLYKQYFIPEYSKRDVWLVAHENSKLNNLPFSIESFFPIKRNAWVNNISLITEISNLNPVDKTILFCAGPLGNILSYQLYNLNPNNTYLDIGSTLNPWLQSEGFKRDYYTQGQFKDRVCVWEV